MSGMAEVLAAHQWYDATTDSEDPATGCTGCADWFGSEDALDDGTFAAHQAAMLSAAGFGPVKEAAAVALEEAADRLQRQAETFAGFWIGKEMTGPAKATRSATSHDARWLRARAAAVRGEG